MAVLSFTKQYSKAVFMDHTKTLNQVPASYQPDVKSYAAGVLVSGGVLQPSGYYVETIDEALASGNVTQEQHDEVLALNPDMLHRPSMVVSEPTV